jgi:hypothetical protein
MLVVLGAFTAPATASASPVLGETSNGLFTPLATGANIKGTNVGEMLWTNSTGGVLTRCTTATWTGQVTKNSGTEIEVDITSASMTGSGSEGRCTETFGNTVITTTVIEGGAAHGLPWCLRANNQMEPDEFQIRGGKCSEASRDIRFVKDVLGGTECEYQRTTAIPGTFTTDTSGQDAVLTISKQKFIRIRGSVLVCPSEKFLDWTFTLETDTESVVPLYIK